MTLGTGIFFSSLALSLVVLFAVTKDRWNWKKITKWVIVAPVLLLSATALCIYVYGLWEERLTPQSEFFGLQLRAVPADVKFAKGEPTKVEEDGYWAYHVGTTASKDRAQYLVKFKDGRVRSVLYGTDGSEIINPYLLGFSHGADYDSVLRKLGPPSFVSVSKDELRRMLSYEAFNVFFAFRASKLETYGIYDPAHGPMKFKDEYAPTEKK